MGSSIRRRLPDGSVIDWQIKHIRPDRWRPHGIRYRFAWIQNDRCRVLFDNHHGKEDHVHLDEVERSYQFVSLDKLWEDFFEEIRNYGGSV